MHADRDQKRWAWVRRTCSIFADSGDSTELVPVRGNAKMRKSGAVRSAEVALSIRIAYTHKVMPNKTIYVKDADLPLFDKAQDQFGESVSSLFAEFLRERLAKLTPEEGRLIELIDQIRRTREDLRADSLPKFIDGVYAEAESYAENSLGSLRHGDVMRSKVFFYAANAYRDRAERAASETRALLTQIHGMITPAGTARQGRKKKS